MMTMGILIPVAIVAVIFLIIAAVMGLKVNSVKGEGGDEMIKNVYVYVVLFATLMMTIGGSVGVFMAASDIISPAPYYQSFAEYRQYGGEMKPGVDGQGEIKLTEEEMLARYNEMVTSETERSVARAKNSLIKSFGWIVIPFPVFIFFQRRMGKKQEA